MKIGILQTGHAPDALLPDHGDYNDLFERLLGGHGFAFTTWSVVDDAFPDGPDDADGWLITGSRHGAYEPHPWIPPLEELIRDIHAAQKPLVGICFGHQIIAQALGGTVEKFPGGWSVGRQSYTLDNEHLHLNAWHQDQVTKLPPEARILGQSAFCENAVLAYGDHILTIQPHPEFDAAFTQGLITHRGGAVPADQLAQAQADLAHPTDSTRIAARIAAHLKQ
ncbi:type 1 glutamine amidotransferase [Aestuariibius sp. 2305UL40-4]|uniref:type 1 glutamine amidotransferase n=1 Tax=Aestuariibius violaceus TaxID=3234132 RepID=UPI00345E6A7E